MAPQGLDWENLMKLNVEEIGDDDTSELYNSLIEFDPKNENNPMRLQKLFQVTQAVLVVKGVEVEEMVNHLKEQASDDGKKTAQKNQEIEDLKFELQSLKKKNKDLEQMKGSTTSNWKDKNLRETIEELEQQISILHKDLKDTMVKLNDERETSDKLKIQCEEYERSLREMKIDNNQLRDDLRDLQRQSDAQRESILMRYDDDQQLNERIKSKNLLLNAALDENRKLSEYNFNLEEEMERMKKEMNEGRNEIDKTADEYIKLKNLVDQNEVDINNYAKENTLLKLQVEELLEKMKLKSNSDDEIMEQVNAKVEEWKLILLDKDERIKEMQTQINKLNKELFVTNLDADKASITALTKVVSERNEEIQRLTDRLNEANKEMNENALVMEKMTKMTKGTESTEQNEMNMMISSLELKLQEKMETIEQLMMRTDTAEKDAVIKDKQMNEMLKKMSLYEQGVYGLPEAVLEMKQLQGKLLDRDRQIEELTQYASRCEIALNEIYDEAEDLRERLGLDPKQPISIEGSIFRRGLNIQRDKSLNRVLQKEIEKLEEERLDLKNQLRSMCQSTGQKIITAGLTLDEMDLIDDVINALKVGGSESGDSQTNQLMIENIRKIIGVKSQKSGTKITYNKNLNNNDNDDNNNNNKRLSLKKYNMLNEEVLEWKSKYNELEMEQRLLEKGLREIKEQLSSNGSGNARQILSSDSIDKLIEIFETRESYGTFDKRLMVKAQLDQTIGRNEELKRELRESKSESARVNETLAKVASKNVSLETELQSYKELGLVSGALSRIQQLPSGMGVSSSDVINSLNEHLLVVLQESSVKDERMKEAETWMDECKRTYDVITHQQALLYADYNKLQKTHEEEVKSLTEELNKKKSQIEDDNIKLIEFDRLLDTLSKDEAEVRRRLADNSRRMLLLKSNEAVLSRKYSLLLLSEDALRKDNKRLTKESIEMQKTVTEKLGYLQRTKDTLTFELSTIQKQLDNSVPSSSLDRANQQYVELLEKYRALLEQGWLLTEKGGLDGHRGGVGSEENMKLKSVNERLQVDLEVQKKRIEDVLAVLEQQDQTTTIVTINNANNNINNNDHIATTPINNNHNLIQQQRTERQIMSLQLRESSERQRANHATEMYEQERLLLRRAEDRVAEMELKFKELMALNLDLQRIERELRDELSHCVLKSVSDGDRCRIDELEKSEMNLKMEVSRLKEVSEVALMQVQAVQNQQEANEKEAKSLRQQLIDIQAQSDEKTVIGQLHHKIVQLEVSGEMTMRKLEKTNKKCENLNASLLLVEQNLDRKNAQMYSTAREAGNRMRHLRIIVQEYRRKFAGSIPLKDQEKFTELFIVLQKHKFDIEENLKKSDELKLETELKLVEVNEQLDGAKELIVTMKNPKGIMKIKEWHDRMQDVRIEAAKLKRINEKNKFKIEFLEMMMKKHEAAMKFVEEDQIRLTQEFEVSEIEWERRELDLEEEVERLKVVLKKYQPINQSDDFAKQELISSSVSTFPDVELPLPEQMEQAIVIINNNMKIIDDGKKTVDHLLKKVETMETKLKEKEGELLRRDRVINDLRLHIPDLLDRKSRTKSYTGYRDDDDVDGSGGKGWPSIEELERIVGEEMMVMEGKGDRMVKATKVAVRQMQAQLDQKEETIANYRRMLEESRQDLAATSQQHRHEVERLQHMMSNRNNSNIDDVKRRVLDFDAGAGGGGGGGGGAGSQAMMRRITELEELLTEQDIIVSSLNASLSSAQQEVDRWRERFEEENRKLDRKMLDLKSEHDQELKQMDRQKVDLETIIERLKQEVDHLKNKDIEYQQDNEQLKNMLSTKSTQQQQQLQQQQQQQSLQQQQRITTTTTTIATTSPQKVPIMQMKRTIESLKHQLACKEQTIKTLSRTLMDMRSDMSSNAQLMVRSGQDKAVFDASVKVAVDEQTKEFKETIDGLNEKIKKLRDENKRMKDQLSGLNVDVDIFKDDMARKDSLLKKVQQERENMATENLELKEKISRMSTMAKQRPETEGFHRELDELRRQNRNLVEELDRIRGSPEKPYEQLNKSEPWSDKWEENRKLQKRCERLVEQLKEKEAELSRLTDMTTILKRANYRNRENQELLSLDSKNKTITKPRSASVRGEVRGAPTTSNALITNQELLRQNHLLADENSFLKQQITSLNRELEECRHQNHLMADEMRLIEKNSKFSKKHYQIGDRGPEYKELAMKMEQYKKENLELASKNFDLNYKLEQANREIPKLKDKIAEQEKYIDLLKSEKKQMTMISKSRESLSSLGSHSSSIKKIGESGRSPQQLERTIAVLKKMLDKIKTENEHLNEQLRNNAGLTNNREMHEQNIALKRELENMRMALKNANDR